MDRQIRISLNQIKEKNTAIFSQDGPFPFLTLFDKQ